MSAIDSEAILSLPAPKADIRLHYGPSKYQFGELRLPSEGTDSYPVVIAIHGGYYRARYGLDYFGHACAALTSAGLATWNIEYRRLGNSGGGWPGTFSDVAAATDYLLTLSAKYPLDLSRVVTLGHSAGGHLAGWVAGRRRIPAGDPLYSTEPLAISGFISLAGVLDLRRAWQLRLSQGVVARLMGGSPKQFPLRYDVTSPLALLPLGVPQTIIHGTRDTSVPDEISRRYATAACASGDTVDLLILEGAGHFDIVDPRSEVWHSVIMGRIRKATGG